MKKAFLAGDLLTGVPRYNHYQITRMFRGRLWLTWRMPFQERVEETLQFVLDGEIVYSFDGLEFAIGAGNGIWLPSGVPFEAWVVSRCRPWVCAVVFNVCDNQSGEPVQVSGKGGALDTCLSDWHSRFESLFNVWEEGEGSQNEAICSSFLHAMLHSVSSAGAYAVSLDPRIAQLRTYLDEHPEELLTLQHMAALVQLNPRYLTRIFKRQVGTGPKSYHVRSRMRYARACLEEGAATVKEISYLLGYSDPSVFSRQFKQHHGFPPAMAKR